MNSIVPIAGCAVDRPGQGIARWSPVALACLLLAACAHNPTASSPPPPRPRPPVHVVVPPPPSSVIAERDLPEARTRAGRGLVRGGLGAVAAEDAGYFLDVLQGRLLQRVGDRFVVSRRSDGIVLRPVAGATWFAPDGTLSADGESALGAVARVLAEYRRTLVVLRASATGPSEARQRLTAATRALSAADLDRRRLLPVIGAAAGPALEIQVEPVTSIR